MNHKAMLLAMTLLSGCGFNLGKDIPPGAAELEVAVEGETESRKAEVSLHEMLSERRIVDADPNRPARFAGLGAAVYAVRIVDLPAGLIAEPKWHYVPLRQGERKRVGFKIRRGAVIEIPPLEGAAPELPPFTAAWLPETALRGTLAQQFLWVLKNESHQTLANETTVITVPLSEEPLWLVVAGPMIWLYGFSERWNPEASNDAPTEPLLETVLLRRIGPVREGEKKKLTPSCVSNIWLKEVILSGRILDVEKRPIPGPFLLVLPESEGAGLFVICDQAGRYELRGLPPGKYRACITRHEQEIRRERLLELVIPAGPAKLDLTLE